MKSFTTLYVPVKLRLSIEIVFISGSAHSTKIFGAEYGIK